MSRLVVGLVVVKRDMRTSSLPHPQVTSVLEYLDLTDTGRYSFSNNTMTDKISSTEERKFIAY